MTTLSQSMRSLLLVVVLATTIPFTGNWRALADPTCVPGVKWLFRPHDLCAETIVDLGQSPGIASISGIAFGPDGSLYFARPATSEIMRLANDHNGIFGEPQRFASGLSEPPNGLAYDSTTNA